MTRSLTIFSLAVMIFATAGCAKNNPLAPHAATPEQGKKFAVPEKSTPASTPTATPAKVTTKDFRWAVTASGTETYNVQVTKTLSGSARGVDDAFGRNAVWVYFEVSYGLAYDNVPVPDISEGELTSVRADGFSARTRVRHSKGETTAPFIRGYFPVGEGVLRRPEEYTINWSVTGFVPQPVTTTVTATVSGSEAIAPGSLLEIPSSVTLQPINGGVISRLTLCMPVAGQNTYFQGSNDFDDSASVDTSIIYSRLNGNMINFTLQAIR